MISSRQTAFETLYRIFYEGAYSNIAVDNAFDKLSAGKAFAARLIYGVVERKITLDYIIKKYSDKSKPKVMTILRMGVYQIYFMDKVPVSAAINESVNLARENGLSFYCKFINAVLHRISENIINIDDIADLSIKYSIPQNLINMLN
ncbi:MAG: 16S rRNA (cytosine(967)-C(5))-methyltransferase RsmB, partial [Clostridiales bacterium]|nr:16S rRNA (cytosine(967)-C(5))-methyltransferase RsmB [Clostridiales bacterium]